MEKITQLHAPVKSTSLSSERDWPKNFIEEELALVEEGCDRAKTLIQLLLVHYERLGA